MIFYPHPVLLLPTMAHYLSVIPMALQPLIVTSEDSTMQSTPPITQHQVPSLEMVLALSQTLQCPLLSDIFPSIKLMDIFSLLMLSFIEFHCSRQPISEPMHLELSTLSLVKSTAPPQTQVAAISIWILLMVFITIQPHLFSLLLTPIKIELCFLTAPLLHPLDKLSTMFLARLTILSAPETVCLNRPFPPPKEFFTQLNSLESSCKLLITVITELFDFSAQMPHSQRRSQ